MSVYNIDKWKNQVKKKVQQTSSSVQSMNRDRIERVIEQKRELIEKLQGEIDELQDTIKGI